MSNLPAALVAESRQTLAVHARSFRWGSFFLPADCRDEAAVVYAFCRLIDDLVDEQGDVAEVRAIRAELGGQAPARPLVAAFQQIAIRAPVVIPAAQELITGVEGDAGVVRFHDDAELLRYCYRVAGTVGLMMCGVLGVNDPRAWPHAIDLGVGMQLTNICRDVAEDAARGRVYLPATRLIAAGTTPEALLAGDADRAAVKRVVADLLALAERYYQSGIDGYAWIPARSRLAIRAAARIYRAIGRRLLATGGDPLLGRVFVPWTGKLTETVRAIFEHLGATPTHPHDPALHVALAGLPGVSAPAPSRAE